MTYFVNSYSTYGTPSEFGNSSDTTCYIGGDNGIVNCTGNAYLNLVFADIIGTSNSSSYWDDLNSPSDIVCTDLDQSCFSFIDNCSADQSCDNVIYTTDKLGNTTLEIEKVSWNNVTKSEWITPSYVLDIDDEDIESDINTYVDIAGDTMTGNLGLDDNAGESPKVIFTNENNYVSQIYEQTTGDLRIEAYNNLEITKGGIVSIDGTDIDSKYVLANTWTSHDNYPATCAAATPFIGTIGDTSTCRGIVSDTSPQLGGYLDTNGQNIGSTSDEIENIYITTNSKIYLGTGQEGEVYYDGSKIIIKVN